MACSSRRARPGHTLRFRSGKTGRPPFQTNRNSAILVPEEPIDLHGPVALKEEDLRSRLARKLLSGLERRLPERRIFIRAGVDTSFVRLSPLAQLAVIGGATTLAAWTFAATVMVLADVADFGDAGERTVRERALYEQRLNDVTAERDHGAQVVRTAREHAAAALGEVSRMQSALLVSERRRQELERGMEGIQSALRNAMRERDEARAASREALARLEEGDGRRQVLLSRVSDMNALVGFLSHALETTAQERDRIGLEARQARDRVADLVREARLADDRNDRMFRQLEEAVAVSLVPLRDMFRNVGYEPERIIERIHGEYSGQGGPLTPLSLSTPDRMQDADNIRANAILREMDRVNLYRIAARKMPFGMPLRHAFRFTSGFGPRWGRMHNGADFAAAAGTPIHATADGVVIHAGWLAEYGRLVKIRHEFGIETLYAHMSRIRVKNGQRVSRGDHIGDIGNTGRSTGPHLHYEIREGGKPVNPMKYIRVARDVH